MAVNIILTRKLWDWFPAFGDKNVFRRWRLDLKPEVKQWLREGGLSFEVKLHKFIIDPHTNIRNSKPRNYVSVTFEHPKEALLFKLVWI